MVLPIDYNDKNLFQYVYSIIRGKGEVLYSNEGITIFPSLVYLIDPQQALEIFTERYNNADIDCRYKHSTYIRDNDLQATINGLGLNADAFWLLIMFCFDYACSVCLTGFEIADDSHAKIDKLIQLYTKNEEAKVQLTLSTSKGKITIADNRTLSILVDWIKQGFERDKDTIRGFSPKEVKNLFCDKSESNSVLIWYFASLLKYFFEINPQYHGKRTKDKAVSLNKNFLISKLIYYTHISTNTSFMSDTETLKGFFKQYKGKKIIPHSSIYPTF